MVEEPAAKAAQPQWLQVIHSPLNKVVEAVKAKLGDAVEEAVVTQPRRATIAVKREAMLDAARFLRELGFSHVISVSGVDYPRENAVHVVYHASSYTSGELRSSILALRARLPRENPAVASLTRVWPSAEYHERETFEMFGVEFEGHPRLERLLLPETWDSAPPLRKEFRLPGRT